MTIFSSLKHMCSKTRIGWLVASIIGISFLGFFVVGWPLFCKHTPSFVFNKLHSASLPVPPQPSLTNVTNHIKTPSYVKAIYITSWVAGIKPWRESLINFVDRTEINAVIIDIKDYSGHISYKTGNPIFDGVEESRIKDLESWIQDLHKKEIYVIARITVFQDPSYASRFPQYAVQSRSTGRPWKDRNGLSYIDPSAKPFWQYIEELGKTCATIGFDELNFDYIRFPTDGNMADMRFPISRLRSPSKNISCTRNIDRTSILPKACILQSFFSHLHHASKAWGVPISADVFGMVLTAQDDLNIGQVLEVAAPYFDFICPMIYPSHYPRGFQKFSNPADHPYDIVSTVLKSGSLRLQKAGYPPTKLRAWLQDFNLKAVYDAPKIQAQHKGVYDAGLTSWMMWDPRNTYTKSAYH